MSKRSAKQIMDQTLISEAEARKILERLRNNPSEENIQYVLNNIRSLKDRNLTLEKGSVLNQIMHQIIGEAARDEISGLDKKNIQDSVYELLERSNPGLLQSIQKVHPDMSIKQLDLGGAFGGYDQLRGDMLFDPAISQNPGFLYGNILHEGVGHGKDQVDKIYHLSKIDPEVQKSKDKLGFFKNLITPKKSISPLDIDTSGYSLFPALDIRESDTYAPFMQSVSKTVDDYYKKNPGKEVSSDILNWKGKRDGEIVSDYIENYRKKYLKQFNKVPSVEELTKVLNNLVKTPLEGQQAYSSNHMFNRNFAFDNLKNILKDGVKGVKSVALPLGAAKLATGVLTGGLSKLAEAMADSKDLNENHLSELDLMKMQGDIEKAKKNDPEAYRKLEQNMETFSTKDQIDPNANKLMFGQLRNRLR